MRKRMFFLLLGLVIVVAGLIYASVRTQPPSGKVVIEINRFQMTKEEFGEDFQQVNVGKEDTPKVRKRFLENLINRKLILQEASRLGLDKEKDFLKAIERFWEQSLLKIMLDRKSKEVADEVSVTDGEIEAYYNEMVERGVVTKPLSEVYNEMKWQLFRRRQTQALNSWIEELRKKAKIEIKDELLGIEEKK